MAQQRDVMVRALALQELVREEAPRTESQGNLTAPVVQALLDAEMFYLMVPAALGGLEVDGRTYLEVVEAISAADGSTGWCVMLGAEVNGMLGVNLPEDIARRILFQHGPICCAGSAIQDGTATIERMGDYYRVSGRWRFASGCNHSAYLFAFAPLCASGQPVMKDNAPTILMPFMGPGGPRISGYVACLRSAWHGFGRLHRQGRLRQSGDGGVSRAGTSAADHHVSVAAWSLDGDGQGGGGHRHRPGRD
jgi:hypothetical protein